MYGTNRAFTLPLSTIFKSCISPTSSRLIFALAPLRSTSDLIESPRVKVGLAEKGGADSATHKLAAGHHAVRSDSVVDRFECDENLPLTRARQQAEQAKSRHATMQKR